MQFRYERDTSTTKLLADINKLGGGIILLFDSVEIASKEDLTWLLKEFVPQCELLPYIGFFQVVVAGRNLYSQGWLWDTFELIKLSELSLSVIERVTRHALQGIDNGFSHKHYQDLADRIFRLSGGHPLSIRNLIMEELLPNKGFLPPSREDEIELFKRHVEPQIEIVIDKANLNKDLCQALDSMFIFRSFYTGNVDFLIKKGKIPQTLLALDSLQKLSQQGLITFDKKSSRYSDAIVRNLIITRWRLLRPNEYIEFNQLAFEYYSKNLDDLFSSAERESLSKYDLLEATVRRTIGEGFYHLCQVQFANSDSKSSANISRIASEIRRYLGFLVEAKVNLGMLSITAYLRIVLEDDRETKALLQANGITIDRLFDSAYAPEKKETKRNNDQFGDGSGSNPEKVHTTDSTRRRRDLELTLTNALGRIPAIAKDPDVLLLHIPDSERLNRKRGNSFNDIGHIITQLWDKNRIFNEEHPLWISIDNALAYAMINTDQYNDLVTLRDQIAQVFEEIKNG